MIDLAGNFLSLVMYIMILLRWRSSLSFATKMVFPCHFVRC